MDARPWVSKLRWFVIAGLIILAAFCFVRYLSWALAYSAIPRPSQASQLADRRAWLFFCVFAGLEMFCTALLAFDWERSDFYSAGLRFAARYGSALALCLLATGIVVGILIGLGRW